MNTNNKTLAVDVLNEMERASERLFDAGLHGDLSLDVARDAVAELIDKVDSYLTLGDSDTVYRELSAALARVKGESA